MTSQQEEWSKTRTFTCTCESLFHSGQITYFPEWEGEASLCYFHVSTGNPISFIKRLSHAFKYIFKRYYEGCYYDGGSILFRYDDLYEFMELLDLYAGDTKPESDSLESYPVKNDNHTIYFAIDKMNIGEEGSECFLYNFETETVLTSLDMPLFKRIKNAWKYVFRFGRMDIIEFELTKQDAANISKIIANTIALSK